MKSRTKFSHDSLLDRQSTKQLLETLATAIKKGKLEFEEGADHLALAPGDLLQVSVRASDEGDKQEVEVRLKWRTKAKEFADKPPTIK